MGGAGVKRSRDRKQSDSPSESDKRKAGITPELANLRHSCRNCSIRLGIRIAHSFVISAGAAFLTSSARCGMLGEESQTMGDGNDNVQE
jgi:hypothetical protein